MDYANLEYFLSQPRMNRFLVAAGNSQSKARQLYRINLRVCQAFYPVFNLFEISLRNSMNIQLSAHFADPSWITNQRTGFMNDPSLGPQYKMRNRVRNTITFLNSRGTPVTTGKMISEQTFGFWTSLFDPSHYRLIAGSVIHCFPHKPAGIARVDINVKLNGIRELRNRIYHNEPICFNGPNVDFTHVTQVRQDIYDLLDWMNPDLADHVRYYDAITEKINTANNL